MAAWLDSISELPLSETDAAFRDEVRTWLDEHLVGDFRNQAHRGGPDDDDIGKGRDGCNCRHQCATTRGESCGTSWSKVFSHPGTYFRSVLFTDAKNGFAGNIGAGLSTQITDATGSGPFRFLPEERIADSLSDYVPPPTRLEVWRSPSGVVLVNDLVSADPISVRAALRTTSELAARGGRKVFVFGGMRELGPAAAAEYSAIGALAGEYRFDALLLIDQDGGGELGATRDSYLAAHPA